MISIDKTTIPYCYLEEKKFEWGEPYTVTTPIFDVMIDPSLSDMEFTIEVLGKNNFKENLITLYNILLNNEETYRILYCQEVVVNRQFFLEKIKKFLDANVGSVAPWEDDAGILNEDFYLEMIEDDLKRTLLFERKKYT